MKEHIIYDSDNCEYDDYGYCSDFDDEVGNLHKELDNRIIIIADLGLWNGRHSGYKVIGSNLNDIMYQSTDGNYKVWFDGHNIKARDSHHDNCNYYEFREIKSGVNIDILKNKIYNGTFTRRDINRYTTSLGKYVKEIYGC